MSDVELAWAAGLFEGEGTIRINGATKRGLCFLVVSIVNTDRQVVEFFNDRWPGYMKPATGLGPRQRPAWVWTIAARKASAFVSAIRPFLRTDRVRIKADHGLSFQDGKRVGRASRTLEYRREQWEAWMWMSELIVAAWQRSFDGE